METKRLHIGKSGTADVEFVESPLLDRYDGLAREAIDECRKSIMMACRFLNAALWHMPFERAPLTRAIATSGRSLRFDPENVVNRFHADHNELTRDCLHLLLHCVFHHPLDKRHEEFDAWSLACDIAVELCALDPCGTRFPCEGDEQRAEEGRWLASLARNTSAQALYQLFRSGGPGELLYLDNGITSNDLKRLGALFKRDSHDFWASRPRENEQETQQPAGGTAEVPDLMRSSSVESDAEGESGSPAETASPFGQGLSDLEPDDVQPDDAREDDLNDLRDEWNRISKQVEAELRASARYSALGEGSLLQSLSIANRKPANYDEFLRRFATVAEDLRVNDDEFDYIYYTYGMQRYGNIPLVEPLEYREAERVREFVIAIDTSGSCSGELVRSFVERTYDILGQQSSFGDEINVHLIQCDNKLRSVSKVSSLRELRTYGNEFVVSGGGGTDFKPVFEYVDKQVEQGEFRDLRGLIYFTDGYGTFPTRAPAYDVAFVFVDVEGMNVRVPPWAMKVLMTQEEVLQR